jgi:glycosyltransferase involved in cell wall biosynthesis
VTNRNRPIVNENPQLPPILGHPQTKQRDELHVLTLTPFFPTEGDDSAGCFVSEPLEELAKNSVTNSVFAVQPFYRGRIRARRDGIQARWFRYFSLPGGVGLPSAGAFLFARIVAEVRRLQSMQPVDLVHAHGPLPCGHAAMLLQAELGLPYVVSVHGLDAFATNQVKGRAGVWCRRISQRVYRSSKRVICVSERVREEVLSGTGRSARTSVVYNGVNPELFSPKPKAAEPDSMVLSVGNLIKVKGHDVLIRAVASLKNEFPAISLEIIGDGPERSRLETLGKELGVQEQVRYRGRRSRQEVAEAMRGCTVFALASGYEALGCVYLEAMAAGKPVIGCRGQGIAELIKHGSNGFLVGPDNDRELALALGMLLRDRARRDQLGAAARDTVLERLTLTEQAGSLTRIYRECAA